MPTLEETISLDNFGEACCHFKGGPCVQALRVASGQQLARSWRWSPTDSQWETDSANNHVNVELYLSPVKPLDENPALADTLMATLWRTQ